MFVFVSDDHMLDWHSCQTCYPLEKRLLYKLKSACTATEKLVRGLKFRIQKLEILYNNKGADQTARMRMLICAFVVCIWHKQVFS